MNSSTPKPDTKVSPERLKSEMAAESQTEFYISPPLSEQAAIRAALQNQEAYRADEAPRSAPDSVTRGRKPDDKTKGKAA